MAQRWLGSICAGIRYRRDWLRRRRKPDAAQAWGLRLLEDPGLDARDAHPAWFPDHDAVVQLYPDADPPPDAHTFEFWRIPGRKQLTHDGKRLVLVSHWPGCCVRLALAPDLEDGSAYLYATRACATPCARYRTLAAKLDALSAATVATPVATARSRPTPAALLELHTLQALDATLAGASLREVGEGLFGADAVAADWHKDSALRARVRRLVRRGDELMHGGYRRLAQLPMFRRIRGRFSTRANRPLARSLAFLRVPLSGRVVWPGLMEVHPMRPAPSRPAAAAVTATSQPQRYLTNDEAADYLRLSPRTLEKQRVIGGGPSSAVRPPRHVRGVRPRCLGRPAQLRGHVRSRIRRAPRGRLP